MALSFSSSSSITTGGSLATTVSVSPLKSKSKSKSTQLRVTKSELNESSSKPTKLEIGSPIIVTEAPNLLKTAASVPCLRVNAGLVKPGDVGRIVSRKPKDVWAVRLSIGTYLIDEKYFKPLELDDQLI